jgi:hypothetical protein
MLDFQDIPIPAIYEHVTRDVWNAILPGMTPTVMPGLSTKALDYAQVPPWPTPSIQAAMINPAAGGTGTIVSNSSTSPALSPYSEVLVWATVRTNILNDPATLTPVVTDSQGGTYTAVGPQQKVSYNNAGTLSTFYAQLFKRDQRVPAAGYGSCTFTMTTVSTPSTSTSTWNAAYVFEIRNPGNYPFKIAYRASAPVTAPASAALTNTGDLFCLDCYVGTPGVVTPSANGGFTLIAGSGAFVSNQLRLQVYASGLRAQNAARAYAVAGTLTAAMVSYGMWFDGPSRSKAKFTRNAAVVARAGSTPVTSSTFTAIPIGPAAADRIVVVMLPVQAGTNTSTTITSTPAPTLPWMNILPGSGGNLCSQWVYIALIPTGTTMDLTITHGSGQAYVYVASYTGAEMFGPNQEGMLLGEVTPQLSDPASATIPTLTGVNVPAGAILFGAVSSRGNSATLTGSYAQEAALPNTANGSAFGVVDNLAGGTDLTALTLGATGGGGTASEHGYAVFGP